MKRASRLCLKVSLSRFSVILRVLRRSLKVILPGDRAGSFGPVSSLRRKGIDTCWRRTLTKGLSGLSVIIPEKNLILSKKNQLQRLSKMKKGLDKLTNNPGILASLRSKIHGTSQRYSDVKDEVSKIEAKKIELVEVSKQLAEVKEQSENARALLEKKRRRKAIEASFKRLTNDYD